jgi:glycosyltransferase involved in cell wall biosynthesis
VCKKDPKFLFLIGGEGSEKPRLKELIKKYNLEDNVFLIGGVSNEELPVYYRSVEMFVTTEFPPDEMLITAIEAMSSGIPVIATSPTGKFEIINQSGLIVPYNNPDKLAKAILTLGYDYKLRNELIKKGLDRSKMYDWNRLVKIYENACNYVITKNINKTT